MFKNWGVFLNFKGSSVCSFERKVIKNQSKNEVEYRHRFLIDFWSIFGPFLEPKSLQNRFRSGFGRALNGDSVSKLKQTKKRTLDALWCTLMHFDWNCGRAVFRGNKEGGQMSSHARQPVQGQGLADQMGCYRGVNTSQYRFRYGFFSPRFWRSGYIKT